MALGIPKAGGCEAAGWLCSSCPPDNGCSFVSPDKPAQSLLQLKGGCLATQRAPKNISTKSLHFGTKSNLWDIFALASVTCRGIKKDQLFAAVGSFLLSFHWQCFCVFLGRMREMASELPQFPFSNLVCGVYFFLLNQFLFIFFLINQFSLLTKFCWFSENQLTKFYKISNIL